MALGVRRIDTTADNRCRQRILREVIALRIVYAMSLVCASVRCPDKQKAPTSRQDFLPSRATCYHGNVAMIVLYLCRTLERA
jgi:hypothetical protein